MMENLLPLTTRCARIFLPPRDARRIRSLPPAPFVIVIVLVIVLVLDHLPRIPRRGDKVKR